MAICANCSGEVPAGLKFCPSCGAQQSHNATDGDLPQLERRLVSVFFAHLEGLAPLGEGQRPTSASNWSDGKANSAIETVDRVLSEYSDTASRIITSYGGVLEYKRAVQQFSGDSILAVWGSQLAHEDDAERSVRAGLDLVAATTELSKQFDIELGLRVGILTGEVSAQLDTSAEGMIVGDAVNTAARIKSAASPGQVWVDAVTRQIAEKTILFDEVGEYEVKGKKAPIHVWRAVGPRGTSAVLTVGVEPPLIGREKQLQVFNEALAALFESNPSLALITISGDAGTGKSRLGSELQRLTINRPETVLWHAGRSLSFGEGIGFNGLVDIVRMRAMLSPTDTADLQRAKIDQLLDDLFNHKPQDRAHVHKALSRLLGLDDGQEIIPRGELFTGWRLLFEQLSSRHPVVLLFEDLHWSDQGQLDFIEHLLTWSSNKPILIVCLSRPDDRVDKLAQHGVCLDLGTFTDDEMEQLITSTVIDPPAQLVKQVRDNAGGIALYAVETLRVLIDRGVLSKQNGRYRVTGQPQELQVPPSIHALIASRLDGLGSSERRVLLNSAVLGQLFSIEAITALARPSTVDTKPLLDELVRKQFLTVERDPQSPERGLYAFVHPLVHRVALNTLSKRDRKDLHLKTAEYLTQTERGFDAAPVVAGHLLAAMELEQNRVALKALTSHARSTVVQAAQQAEGIGALEQAGNLYDRLAEMESDDDSRASTIELSAKVADRAGDSQGAVDRFHRAADLREAMGQHREALRLQALDLQVQEGQFRSVDQQLPIARALYEELSDKRDAAFAQVAISFAYSLFLDAEYEEAARVGNEAVKAARLSGDEATLAHALDTAYGPSLVRLERLEEAIVTYREALQLAQRAEPGIVPRIRVLMSGILGGLGYYEDAQQAAEIAIQEATRIGHRLIQLFAQAIYASGIIRLGRWDEGVGILEDVKNKLPLYLAGEVQEMLPVYVQRGAREKSNEILNYLHTVINANADAQHFIEPLMTVTQATLNRDSSLALKTIIDTNAYNDRSTWLPLAVNLLTESPNKNQISSATAALERGQKSKTTPLVASQIERLKAHLATLDNDPKGAIAHWQKARAITVKTHMPFETAVLALEVVENTPTTRDSKVLLDQAIQSFTELRAEPWLRRAMRSQPH